MYLWSPKETTLVPCVMYSRAHNQALFSTILLVSIREYNGWLLTRKGSSAFKLALFTAKISLLNLIQIFYENYHYRFEIQYINFRRFLAALCRFILLKENRKKLGLDSR